MDVGVLASVDVRAGIVGRRMSERLGVTILYKVSIQFDGIAEDFRGNYRSLAAQGLENEAWYQFYHPKVTPHDSNLINETCIKKNCELSLIFFL